MGKAVPFSDVANPMQLDLGWNCLLAEHCVSQTVFHLNDNRIPPVAREAVPNELKLALFVKDMQHVSAAGLGIHQMTWQQPKPMYSRWIVLDDTEQGRMEDALVPDFLFMSTKSFKVPCNKKIDVLNISHSLMIDFNRGEVTTVCRRREIGAALLSLAKAVAEEDKTVHQARDDFEERKEFLAWEQHRSNPAKNFENDSKLVEHWEHHLIDQ